MTGADAGQIGHRAHVQARELVKGIHDGRPLGSRLIDGHTEVHGRVVAFRDLLAHFLRALRSRAEQSAGRAFDAAVFGRPVHFVDDDAAADAEAQATLEAIARASGFRELSFELEPIAAAYDYERTLERETLVLVCDIGGGTSDFSLLRLGPNAAKVTPEERARLFAQHFAYRRALYEAGDILMYGPFEEATDPAFRGLSIFRGDKTLDEVKRLVAEDPYVKSGIMQADVMVWLTEPPRIEEGFGVRQVDVPGQ